MHADRVLQTIASAWKPHSPHQTFWWNQKKLLLSGDHPRCSDPMYCAMIHDQAEIQAGPIEVLYQADGDLTLEESLVTMRLINSNIDTSLLRSLGSFIVTW
jgi:hypothetical protein